MSSPPDIAYEWISYTGYATGPGDTVLRLERGSQTIGELYGSATQVWYRQTGALQPAYTLPDFEPGNWYLLYDYAMQSGDTAYYDLGNLPATPVIVDSVTVSSQYASPEIPLKVFHLSNGDVIVEKIGSLGGLFRPYATTFEHSQSLCSGEGHYSGPESSFVGYHGTGWPCNGVLGLPERGMQTVVYPNPFTNELHISAETHVREVLLFDGAGRMMKRANGGGTELVVDAAGLSPGIYFVELQLEDGRLLRRSCTRE